MIRIAMLGSDSSHTDAYCELTNLGKSNISCNANVEILWGESFNETKRKAKKYNIKSVSKNLQDINFEDIDLVMVVGRFGDSHKKPAEIAIKNKIATFVDKPFTNNLNEARYLVKLAESKNTKLTSFSPLRYASEIISLENHLTKTSRPLNLMITSPFITKTVPGEGTKSIYFYSIHAADICLSIVKSRPISVTARKINKAVMVDLIFENSSSAILHLTYDQDEIYNVISFENGQVNSVDIDPEGNYYENTLDHLLNFVKEKEIKDKKFHTRQALYSIHIIDAIEKSLDSNTTIELSY
jgi:predicted dehydrogenase